MKLVVQDKSRLAPDKVSSLRATGLATTELASRTSRALVKEAEGAEETGLGSKGEVSLVAASQRLDNLYKHKHQLLLHLLQRRQGSLQRRQKQHSGLSLMKRKTRSHLSPSQSLTKRVSSLLLASIYEKTHTYKSR